MTAMCKRVNTLMDRSMTKASAVYVESKFSLSCGFLDSIFQGFALVIINKIDSSFRPFGHIMMT